MAQDLSDIISVSITVASSGITRTGFGTVLIGGWHDRWVTAEKTRSYSKTADMVTDGFATTDLEYIAASKVKGQTGGVGAPKTFKVGRLDSVANGPTQVMHLTPATAVSTLYSGKLAITGSGTYQSWSFTSSATANTAEILAGLTAAIAALQSYSGNIVAATASGKVTITGAAVGKHFALKEVSDTFSMVTDETADPGVATDLNNLLAQDANWYALVCTYKSDLIAAQIMTVISTLRKVYILGTMDRDVIQSGSSDVASVMKAASYDRAIVLFNDDHMLQADAALAGVWLPYDPGSETLMFKKLTGITATNLTTTAITQLDAKNCNYYVEYAGVSIVKPGKVSSGKFADLIRFVDWLYANIQEDLFDLLVKNPKVPFSVAGITQVQGTIDNVLQRGVRVGGLLPDYTVEVPALEDVTAANKEARNLSPVTFECTSAGAIHGVTITGTVAV